MTTVLTRRVLCLTRAQGFQTPRAWHFQARYGVLTGGQARPAARAGDWLLEMGPARLWAGQDASGKDQYIVEYLYRLATGEVVALDQPLAGDAATEVADPQVVAAMNAYRSLDEALLKDMGIMLHREHPDLPPFALIKCPLCGGTDFVTLDLASAWCRRCNANFNVRSTAGDPGFVVDCGFEHLWLTESRYVLPPVSPEVLSLYLVLKDSDDPRDLTYVPERCDWTGKCLPGALNLTGDDTGLRSGLHACRVGTLYDWKLSGSVPSPWSVRADRSWEIDGQSWPACATLNSAPNAVDRDKRPVLARAARALREMAGKQPTMGPDDVGLEMVAAILDGLAQPDGGQGRVYVWTGELPLISSLAEDEQYLLHHWLLEHGTEATLAWPIWYVVKADVTPDGHHQGWQVVRKDVCPSCGRPALPGVPAGKDPHRFCREFWEKIGWEPPAEAPEGEKPDARLPRKGDRVQTSGRGRTAHWPHQTGRVSRRQGNAVFVYWSGGSGLVEDEMDVDEVELLPDSAEETTAP